MTRNNSHDPLARAASSPPSLFSQPTPPAKEMTSADRAQQARDAFADALNSVDAGIESIRLVTVVAAPDKDLIVEKALQLRPSLSELRILSAKLRNALLIEGGAR